MRKSTYKKWRFEKQERENQIDLKEIAAAAIHEAGHAVAEEFVQVGIQYAELHDNRLVRQKFITRSGELASSGISTGFTQPNERPLNNPQDFYRECFTTLAGPIAEEMFTRENAIDDGDRTQLLRYSQHLKLPPDEAQDIFKKALNAVCTFLENDSAWGAVKDIAQILMVERRISGDEVRAIVDRNDRGKMMAAA